MDRPAFVYVAYIATTPEKLWEALTDGEFTRRYWGGRRIESDWNVGSAVRHISTSSYSLAPSIGEWQPRFARRAFRARNVLYPIARQ
jgi:hypothetical protein